MSDKKVKFIFYYNVYELEIKNKTINDLLYKFTSILNIDIKDLSFIYKGKKLLINQDLLNLKFEKNATIFVFLLLKYKHNKYFQNILCNKCKNPCQMNYNNDIVSFNNCLKKHNFSYLSFKDYYENSEFDEMAMKCDLCGNSQYLYIKKLKICSCNKIICPLCLNMHNFEHKAFEYKTKFFKCNLHNKLFELFCLECNKNICNQCDRDHQKHKKVYFKEIKPKINEIKRIKVGLDETQEVIKEYINELNRTNNIFHNFIQFTIENFNAYSKLNDCILNSLTNIDYINYQEIKNIYYINNLNEIFKKSIKEFLNYSFKNRFKNLFEVYEKKRSELIITYKNEEEIKLFDKSFVNNNKNNCYLIVNNKKMELCEFIKSPSLEKKEIKVKLIKERVLKDISCMFYECKSLLNLKCTDFFDNNEIVNIRCMFANCVSLEYLPDIFNWNTTNIKDICYLFYKCSSLKKIPNISNWNTINISNMLGIFCGCKSLTNLPDISNWNTSNVKNMSYMFRECKSLLSIPDISKWNTSNVTDMSNMFNICETVKSLPDISNWKISNVTNISNMFYGCKSILNMPDISKWDTSKVINMSHLFQECKSLKYLPDISNWNISNAKNMKLLFANCDSLLELPDISKWKTSNDIDISKIIEGSTKLKILPNIYKWINRKSKKKK